MNLADAIRQAANNAGAPLPQPEADLKVVENPSWGANAPEEKKMAHESNDEVRTPDAPSPVVANGGGSVVRMELFLSPEQLSGLFKAVVASQHSVMTLREAASYLRIPASTLEQMAQEGQVPAMLIDGRWRFPRNGVDEWLSVQTHQKEA